MSSRSTAKRLAEYRSRQEVDGTVKASPGWYVDKRWPGEQRRWDGTRWLDEWRPVASPWATPGGFMLAGFLLALGLGLVSGIALTQNETAGWWLLWVSSGISGTVFTIGMIGKAVEIGMRAARG